MNNERRGFLKRSFAAVAGLFGGASIVSAGQKLAPGPPPCMVDMRGIKAKLGYWRHSQTEVHLSRLIINKMKSMTEKNITPEMSERIDSILPHPGCSMAEIIAASISVAGQIFERDLCDLPVKNNTNQSLVTQAIDIRDENGVLIGFKHTTAIEETILLDDFKKKAVK